MICKASQRGGGAQLAAHLLNAHDNERVEVADMRGSVARDLAGAFREWHAQSKATNCQKYLYSMSISPDQRQGRMTKDQYLELIGRYEKSLGLTQQGRAVVFHEKKDQDGVPREHCHVVWNRVDARRGRAITISFDRLKRLAITRAFARELGRTIPKGMEQPPGPERFAAKAANSNHKEKQQEERSGITKEQRIKAITEAWRQSHDGPGFVEALKNRGYRLTQGGRLSYAVVDIAGNVHPMGTLVAGVRAAEVKARLSTSHPISSLPPQEEVKQQVAAIRAKATRKPSVQKPDLQPDALRTALQEQQAQRRQELAKVRSMIEERHRRERLSAPSRQMPPEGIVQRVAAQFKAEARVNRVLERRHKAELRDLVRQERNLKTLDAREARSLDTKIKRHDLQGIAESLRGFVPILDRLDQRLRIRQAMEEQRADRRTARGAFDHAGSERTTERTTPATTLADEAKRAAERLADQERARQQQQTTPKPRPGF